MTRRSRATTGAIVLAGLLVLPRRSMAILATLQGDAATSSGTPATKAGGATSLQVSGAPATNTIRRIYLQFNLTTLPPGTTANDVSKATLTVFGNTVTTEGSFDVVRVTSAWTEELVTYNSAPTLGSTEQSAVAVNDKNDFVTVDVTAAVKAWLDASLTNNGLALVANGTDGLNVKFDSKENTSKAHTPKWRSR